MSLINAVRDKRDSWLVRFEEQRQPEEYTAPTGGDRDAENERVLRNRAKVGVFPKKADFGKEGP